MIALLRSFWTEPPPPGRSGPGLWDVIVVVVAVIAGGFEVAFSPSIDWAAPATMVSLARIPVIVWRRVVPLMVLAVVFTSTAIVDLFELAAGVESLALGAGAVVLTVPYALTRWGSGREMVFGVPLMLVAAFVGLVADNLTMGEMIGGFGVLLTASTSGAIFRFRAQHQRREMEQVKLRERESLARDLHDTVAHHVSAITIRSQAGLAVAAQDPTAAVDALRVIEAESKRTLAEMRAMVVALRDGQTPQFTPLAHIGDLRRLTEGADEPAVVLDVQGDVDGISTAVSAAIYHLAQEAITNARRHARHARRIEVTVIGDETSVRLRVRDDGEKLTRPPAAGFGLVGMRERTELLGGTFGAGPGADRGWMMYAVLPKEGPSA
ncbi:MAG: histidine kinase [Myxococcota bacterium]